MLISLYSPKGSYDGVFLANYGYINLFDQLTRVPGIGNVDIRRGPVCNAAVGKARPAREARHHRSRHYYRRAKAEHGQPGRAGRRRTDSQWTEIHLHGAGAGPIANAGGIWRDRR